MMEEKRSFIEMLEIIFVMADIDVCSLELVDEDTVRVTYFGGGERLINIHMDSKLGIIQDIAKQID